MIKQSLDVSKGEQDSFSMVYFSEFCNWPGFRTLPSEPPCFMHDRCQVSTSVKTYLNLTSLHLQIALPSFSLQNVSSFSSADVLGACTCESWCAVDHRSFRCLSPASTPMQLHPVPKKAREICSCGHSSLPMAFQDHEKSLDQCEWHNSSV